MDIAKYLNNAKQAIGIAPTTNATTTNTFQFGANSGTYDTAKRIASYVGTIILVLLVILLFVHYFITPIFKFNAGAPGKILIPGFDDGTLFWNRENAGQIPNKNLPIYGMSFNYTITLDMFIQNPLQFSTSPRILFRRGGNMKDTPSGDTLLGVVDNYNVAVALLPDTNDMIVSVLNKDNNMENVIVPNVPVQEPFRLGMVVMEHVLEVYLNGQLVKTRAFHSPPKNVLGDIYIASDIEINIAKLRNLKIWTRMLTVPEIRYATPSLSSAKEMGAGPMPSSSMCSN
jgi:hypothetical protein